MLRWNHGAIRRSPVVSFGIVKVTVTVHPMRWGGSALNEVRAGGCCFSTKQLIWDAREVLNHEMNWWGRLHVEVPDKNREQPFVAIIQIHNPSRSTSHHCQVCICANFFGREHWRHPPHDAVVVAWRWIAGLQCVAWRSSSKSGKEQSRAKSGGTGWKGQSLPGCLGWLGCFWWCVCWHHLFWHCVPFIQSSRTMDIGISVWRHVNIGISYTINFMNSLLKQCIVHPFLVFTSAALQQW